MLQSFGLHSVLITIVQIVEVLEVGVAWQVVCFVLDHSAELFVVFFDLAFARAVLLVLLLVGKHRLLVEQAEVVFFLLALRDEDAAELNYAHGAAILRVQDRDFPLRVAVRRAA